MKIDTMPKKKILAGATAVVALSGFVPAINSVNAASPTATANVGVSVVIQQAITLVAGANVDFGTIILSAATIAGAIGLNAAGNIVTGNLTDEVSLAGGHAAGSLQVNASAGAVNIALGAAPTDDGGNITYPVMYLGGTGVVGTNITLNANSNKNFTLTGAGVISTGSYLVFNAKPTPGIYNSAFYTITVTDI